MDPHVVVRFPQDEALAPQALPDHADAGNFIHIDDTMGFDMRVGDRKRRKAEESTASAIAGARNRGASVKVTAKEGGGASGGRRSGAKSGATKTSVAGNTAKPAGPMPKGWQCMRKMHKSGQKAGQSYKVYLAPGGQQYLSYASAQLHFSAAKPKPPAEAAPMRADFLPPEWLLCKRKRGDEFLGPAGLRSRSWRALSEHLAAADAAKTTEAAATATETHLPNDWQPRRSAAPNDGPNTDMLGTASWLWRLAREVHIGMPGFASDEKCCARHIRLLRMARSEHH